MLIVFLLVAGSCKKENMITDQSASLTFTADTLFFDTVFTSTGSVTKSFKIINNNSGKIKVTKIALAGGSNSTFQLNVNGVEKSEVSNITIDANDSIYVFVRVNISPTVESNPFIITDNILIQYNGNEKSVALSAHGQNAVFLKVARISDNTTWDSTLPYVILEGLTVDSNATLTLMPGTRVFLHATAPVIVHGTLTAKGTIDKPITFASDRLDEEYRDLPGSWPGIWFKPSSKGSFLEFVTIKNAYRGIIAEGPANTSAVKIILSKSIIDNIYEAGILAVNSNINADNLLIRNCGQNVSITGGGSYDFVHCTVATFGNTLIDHKNPVLSISNSMIDGDNTVTSALRANFTNCIFWGENGNVEDEIAILQTPGPPFEIRFNHVLYKAHTQPASATFLMPLQNIDPQFDSVNIQKNTYNLHLSKIKGSAAIDAGIITDFTTDLDGKRRDNKPDLGCYEN